MCFSTSIITRQKNILQTTFSEIADLYYYIPNGKTGGGAQ
jgi:hypothetical protein